jgi:hypothetical protein
MKWKHQDRMLEVSEKNGNQEVADQEWLQQFAYVFMPDPEVLEADQPEGTGETLTISPTLMKSICEHIEHIVGTYSEK